MNNVSIQLGSVELRDFEIPPYIVYGGNYRLSIHRLASGRRAFERLGPEETDIRFSGAFSGPDAAYRARAIDNMRLAGDPVWLTWSSLRYRVIVRSFLFRYKNPLWVEYQARCIVVDEPGTALVTALSNVALALSDLASAGTALPSYAAEFATLGAALGAGDAFTAGTADALTASNTATAVESGLDTFVTNCGGTVQSVDLAGTQDLEGAQLVSAYRAAGQLAAAVVSRNYIRRISCTLNTIGN